MKRGRETATHNGGLQLGVFSEADLDDMHSATLEVLERAGVLVEDQEALDVFADGGCRVDRETRIVKIPPHVIADALHSVRPSFRICGRDPKDDVLIEPGRVTFAPFAEGLMVNDLETGEHRPTVKDDIGTIVRLCDALDELELPLNAVAPRDVPPETAALHSFEVGIQNTTKPYEISSMSKRDCELVFEAAAIIAGGHDALRERPFVYLGACPVAPLVLGSGVTGSAIAHAREGIPFLCVSMGMQGGSTPITLAGTLIVQNCELLATLALMELVNRGNGYWYGTSTCSMDMRWGSSSVGSPETALYCAGTAAMATYYGIPSWTAGY